MRKIAAIEDHACRFYSGTDSLYVAQAFLPVRFSLLRAQNQTNTLRINLRLTSYCPGWAVVYGNTGRNACATNAQRSRYEPAPRNSRMSRPRRTWSCWRIFRGRVSRPPFQEWLTYNAPRTTLDV